MPPLKANLLWGVGEAGVRFPIIFYNVTFRKAEYHFTKIKWNKSPAYHNHWH